MFSVRIIPDGLLRRRRSAGLLHLVSGFFLIAKCADYYRYTDYVTLLRPLPFFVLALLSLTYGFFRPRLDVPGRHNGPIRLLQAAGFAVLGALMVRWGTTLDVFGLFLWAALSLLLWFNERRIFGEFFVDFREEGILVPGYRGDHLIPWEEVQDVVVREDFLTLFHRKEKYLQFSVAQSLSVLEGVKITAWCKEQIQKADGSLADQAQNHTV